MTTSNNIANVTTPLPREGKGGGASIEPKIGFDEIRTLLKGHCISRLGTERVDDMRFQTDAEKVRYLLAQVDEIRQILDTDLQLPGEDFFDMRLPIRRIRVEGVYLEENEMWELKRSLDTLHAWLAVIRVEEAPYKNLERLAHKALT